MNQPAFPRDALHGFSAALLFAFFFATPAWAQLGGSIDNVIQNGDFESGTNWGGTVMAPEGWTNVQISGGSYLPPETVPISGARSLITDEGTVFFPGNRGQITMQDGLSMGSRWRLQYDITSEDPLVTDPGDSDSLSHSMTIVDASTTNNKTFITLWIRDIQPDNGVAELWLRTSSAPDPRLVGEVPGFGFTSDVSVSNLTHQIVIDGHFNNLAPSFDIAVNLNDGSTVTFPGLTAFGAVPQQGDSPTRIQFIGDSFSSGLAKIDNVEMGSVVSEITRVDVDGTTGLQFNTAVGATYVLQYATTNLVWVDTGLQIDGNGSVKTVFDPEGFATNRMYQVVEEGP